MREFFKVTGNIVLSFSHYSVLWLKSFGRLVLDKWEVRLRFFDSKATIQEFPLGSIVLLPILFLFLLLLRGHGQLLKLITIHFHVAANDLIGDGSHRLVPVLLLGSIEQASHDDWVGLDHV